METIVVFDCLMNIEKKGFTLYIVKILNLRE